MIFHCKKGYDALCIFFSFLDSFLVKKHKISLRYSRSVTRQQAKTIKCTIPLRPNDQSRTTDNAPCVRQIIILVKSINVCSQEKTDRFYEILNSKVKTICCLLGCYSKVHYRPHNSPSLSPILSRKIQCTSPIPYFFNIHFNIITIFLFCVPFIFSTENSACIALLNIRATCTAHPLPTLGRNVLFSTLFPSSHCPILRTLSIY